MKQRTRKKRAARARAEARTAVRREWLDRHDVFIDAAYYYIPALINGEISFDNWLLVVPGYTSV